MLYLNLRGRILGAIFCFQWYVDFPFLLSSHFRTMYTTGCINLIQNWSSSSGLRTAVGVFLGSTLFPLSLIDCEIFAKNWFWGPLRGHSALSTGGGAGFLVRYFWHQDNTFSPKSHRYPQNARTHDFNVFPAWTSMDIPVFRSSYYDLFMCCSNMRTQ